jgi:hypothetical protein
MMNRPFPTQTMCGLAQVRMVSVIGVSALLAGCSALGLGSSVKMEMPAQPQASAPAPVAEEPVMTMPPVTEEEAPPPDQMASMTPPPPIPRPRPPIPRRVTPPMPPAPAAPPHVPEALPPSIAVNMLIGSDFMAIRQVFRSPDTIQNSNLSVVWIYSPPGCTLQLFFYPDIATTTFRLLKYDFRSASGEILMSGDPCMQQMLANRGAPK